MSQRRRGIPDDEAEGLVKEIFDAVWEELRRLFTDAEIVEISLITDRFNMINRLNDSFCTELEPEEYNRTQHRAVGARNYACRICSGGSPGSVPRR